MKLLMNEASPYARLIRVLLIETGLEKETELVCVDPWASPQALLAANPASKVPTLILGTGIQLVESTCIADYLIHRSGRQALSPLSHADAAERLRVLGLGRTAMDGAFGSVIQQRFAPGSPLSERWLGTLPRIAKSLETASVEGRPSTECDLADLTVAVAFEYIDFRLPDLLWKDMAPRLREQVSWLGQRASMVRTRPI